MPSVGHVAIGLAAARMGQRPARMSAVTWAVLLIVVACLPDIDVIAFSLGIPYHAPFGHRGASHSLLLAAAAGLLVGLAALAFHLPALRVGLAIAFVMATHGLLDTLTDGGLGVALLWPFSDARYFAPWRPIPVAPIGRRLIEAPGLKLMLYECVLFLPALLVGLWPRASVVDRGTAGDREN
jgi:inner membrane protein